MNGSGSGLQHVSLKAGFQVGNGIVNYRGIHNIHYHWYYEIIMHVKNGGKLLIDDCQYEMKPYDLFIIPPYTLHGFYAGTEVLDYERTLVYISDEVLAELGRNIIHFENVFSRANMDKFSRVQLSEEEFTKLRNLLLQAENADSETATDYERLDAMNRLSMFFLEIAKLTDKPLTNVENRHVSPLMVNVLDYINENYTTNCAQEEIAKRFNISKYYLAHEFSRVFHISVYQYVLMCRIAQAERLILRGEPFSEVAFKCGFNDYSNFLRVFRNISGQTPREFLGKHDDSGENEP